MIKNRIRILLKDVLGNEGFEDVNFTVEHPVDEAHGDYSTNIAMAIFAKSKTQIKSQKFGTPMELAGKIAAKLKVQSEKLKVIKKVEVAKPGFINFWLSKEYLIEQLSLISGKNPLHPPLADFAGHSVMVEFTDPNPFKEFHIGHLYSNAVGESISRLLEAQGANVKRANYQGDVGLHVAKAIWGMKNEELIINNLTKKDIKEKIKILGNCYARGAKKYEEDENAKREIEELNKKIYAKDQAIMPLYRKGRQWSLEYFETIYERLGTKFDFYYFESEVGVDGFKIVKEYVKKGVFEESQNAVIFPGEKHGLHNRVFINSLGLPTYEAKDLGLAFKKYSDFKFDQSISVTGNEIIGYFKVILAALKQINPELAAKIRHLSHGMVRLPTGKMSSRTGNILTGEWLLDEAKKLLKNKFPEMEEATLEKVAVGSVKYALLKSSIGHDIEFNFEESINLRGNSGPYLQYAYARTQSVLAKSMVGHPELVSGSKSSKNEMPKQVRYDAMEPEEIVLLRTIYRFPEVVEEAGEKFAPNLLCSYLFDLAQKFNLFYQKHKILGEIGEVRDFRVSLTAAVGQILKNGLNLLGIQAPGKM